MPVVIDGYNLLHARGDEPSAASRGRLVRDLVRWAGVRQRRGAAVLDSESFASRLDDALEDGAAADDAGEAPRRPGRHAGRTAAWLRGL